MATSRLRTLGRYLRPYWRKIGLGILALFLVNCLGIYIPLLIRDSIDALRQDFSYQQLLGYVALLGGLASVMWVIRLYSRLTIFGVGRQIEFDLKQRIFNHLLKLEPEYFSNNTSGDLINRSTSDVDNVRRLVGFALLSLANTIFAYALTIPAMLAINVPLSLTALTVYPLMILTVGLFSGRLQTYQRFVQEHLSDLSQLVQEDISGIAPIKIYAQEENERAAFQERNQVLLESNLKLARVRNLLFPLVEGLTLLSLLALLWLGSRAIAAGSITVGDLVALLIFVERLVFPTAFLGFTITAYQRGEVSVDRVEAILQFEPKVKDAPPDQLVYLTQEQIQGRIEARQLTYYYPNTTRPALAQVSFIIEPGEMVAVVGPIGSGKSTLANAFARLLAIAPEQLFLDHQDITRIRLQNLRQAIAYVPQESFLFSATIKDNIRYGDPLKELSEVEYAAKQAQIHPEILNFPQHYETLVGERGITLSGGQRQRTALARALVIEAQVLILDDCLSSVDNQTATQILGNLSRERDRTIIFISHQMSAAAIADRILVMDQGRIVQVGTHAELLEQRGLYQSLWQQHQLEEVLR